MVGLAPLHRGSGRLEPVPPPPEETESRADRQHEGGTDEEGEQVGDQIWHGGLPGGDRRYQEASVEEKSLSTVLPSRRPWNGDARGSIHVSIRCFWCSSRA